MLGLDNEHPRKICPTREPTEAHTAEPESQPPASIRQDQHASMLRRLEKNRRTAAESRKRRREEKDFYERRISHLEAENARLRCALSERADCWKYKNARGEPPSPAVVFEPPALDESETAFWEWLAAQSFPQP